MDRGRRPYPGQPDFAARASQGSRGVGRPDAAAGADVEPIRPVAAAVHPLESARDAETRPEPSPAPEAAETPLLARAFLGVDRHPAVADDRSELKTDPFEDHQWDQRDQPEDQDDGQLTFGSEPVA